MKLIKNILIIGINYEPEKTGIAPYTTGLADILRELESNVTVFTGIPHYPSWKINPEDKFRLRTSYFKDGISIRRFRHFVPKKQSIFRRLYWELTFLVNVLFFNNRQRPDLIISVTPSLSAGLLGVYFSRKYKVPLLNIVQDLVGIGINQSGLSKFEFLGKFVGKLEGFICRKSNLTAVISLSFLDYLRKFGCDTNSIYHFPNWSHISVPTFDKIAIRNNYGWKEDSFIIMHTGNIGLKQNLTNLVKTAKLLQEDPRFVFVICGDGNDVSVIKQESLGLSNIVLMEPVSEMDYPNLLEAADLMIVNERKSVGHMSLPSKLTSYFFAGKPVLAAVDSAGACAKEIMRTPGAGMVVEPENPIALKDAILFLSNNPVILEKMSGASVDYATQFLSLEKAKKNVGELLQMFNSLGLIKKL